jgi:FAD synthase
VRIEFVARLRDEQKFRDIVALKDQLAADREKTIELFRRTGKGNSE